MTSAVVTLSRFAYTPMGVFGTLQVGGKRFYTVERPWKGNEQGVSCIPAGSYQLRKRASEVVKKSSRGAYQEGWEVTGVPGRTFIMIHPGNTMDDLEGCIAVGTGLGYVNNKWAITNSQVAFKELMAALEGKSGWELRIKPSIPVEA